MYLRPISSLTSWMSLYFTNRVTYVFFTSYFTVAPEVSILSTSFRCCSCILVLLLLLILKTSVFSLLISSAVYVGYSHNIALKGRVMGPLLALVCLCFRISNQLYLPGDLNNTCPIYHQRPARVPDWPIKYPKLSKCGNSLLR